MAWPPITWAYAWLAGWLVFTGLSYYIAGRRILKPGNRWRLVATPIVTIVMSGLVYLDIAIPYTIFTAKSLGYIILMALVYALLILPATIIIEILLLRAWAEVIT